jgi:hypothetical protein
MTRRTAVTFLPDLPGLFLCIIFPVLVFFYGGKVLVDGDTFWHVKAGLTMLEKGSLLTRDIFSHTAYGTSWTAHEWLAEIVMALVHRLAGLQGLAIFYFFIAALSFWILFKVALRFSGEWISMFCLLVAFSFSKSHLLARPHLFSWLFGAITLYVLVRGGRKLFFLPLITALWANFHGGFILGLALQGIFLAGILIEGSIASKTLAWRSFWREQKFPLLIMLASILASGINPFGYHLLIFPFLVTQKIFSTGIGEWLPPNMQDEHLFRFFLLGILLLLSLPGIQTSWTNRLLLLVFLNAALSHQRNISIASMVLIPFLAQALTSLKPHFPRFSQEKAGPGNLRLSGASGLLTAAILFVTFMAANTSAFPSGQKVFQAVIPVPEKNHPIEAVAFLNANPIPGKMFNKYGWGGYLIYALDPAQKVFIDGRADMYGEIIFGDYQKIVGIEEENGELLRNYEIGWVLFPHDTPMVRYLTATGHWREIYRDDLATILIRKSKGLSRNK